MRRVCDLPLNCRSAVVQILSDALPLFDVICKRAVMFASSGDVASCDANHSGAYFSRLAYYLDVMFFSCEHFTMSVAVA